MTSESGSRPYQRMGRRADVPTLTRIDPRRLDRRTEATAGRPCRSTGTRSSLSPVSFVLVERPVPEVAVVTLNRPERMNAMAFDVMVPFRDALVDLGHDNAVRAVVLTGAGEGFCSGADQESAGRPPHVDGLGPADVRAAGDGAARGRRAHPAPAAPAGDRRGQRRGHRRRALPRARLRHAGRAPTAYFRAAGINNGLTASELGLSFLLPRAIGSTRAADIMLTGRDVGAEEAERIGLVSSVVRRRRGGRGRDRAADRGLLPARRRAHQEVAARRASPPPRWRPT